MYQIQQNWAKFSYFSFFKSCSLSQLYLRHKNKHKNTFSASFCWNFAKRILFFFTFIYFHLSFIKNPSHLTSNEIEAVKIYLRLKSVHFHRRWHIPYHRMMFQCPKQQPASCKMPKQIIISSLWHTIFGLFKEITCFVQYWLKNSF